MFHPKMINRVKIVELKCLSYLDLIKKFESKQIFILIFICSVKYWKKHRTKIM